MKKLLTTALAVLIAAAALAGCAPKTGGSSSSSQKEPPTLKEVHEAVKEAYGEDYLANTPIEKEQMTEIYGITMDNVEEYIAEQPMITMHADLFIAIRAKEGKIDAVKAELEKFQKYLIDESFQYPFNMPKVSNTTLLVYGNDAYLLMLGGINPDANADMEAQEKFASEQVKIGVDVVKKLYEGDKK